jgi:membrane protein
MRWMDIAQKILCDDTRAMAEYRKWTVWVTWSRQQAWPYVEQLLSNEIYVYTSAISMNALFSFTPFVILMISVSNYLMPGLQLPNLIFDILRQYLPFTSLPMPPLNRSDLDAVIYSLRLISKDIGKAQLISTLILVWSVASVFIPLEMTLNHALGIKESRGFWRSQWLAVKMVLLLGAISFVFLLGAHYTGSVVGFIVPSEWTSVIAFLNVINIKVWMVPLTLITSCIVFKAAPNASIPFRDVWPPAILTGLLWEVLNYVFVAIVPLLGLYPLFGIFTVAVTWMIWAYFGALLLVLGANLMAKQVLTKQIDKMKEALWSFKIESPL